MSYLTSGLIACLLTLVVLLIHLRARMAFRGFPPRHGGTAMALALATVWSLALVLPIGTSRMPAQGLYPILVGAVIVFLVGWIDDMRPLPPLIKLLGQIAGASASYAVGVRVGFLESGVLNYGLTAFCLVGGANAMNLIDGLDGLAAGISAIAAGTFFFIAHDVGQVEAAVLSVSLAGASLAFLWLNLPPARVFMGDSGSNLLGFGLGAVPLLLSSGGDGFENFSVGVLVLAVPIVETATSIGRRLLKGRSPLAGDRNHIHHRLFAQGWSVGSILALLHGITLILGILVLFGRRIDASIDRPVAAWLALGCFFAFSAGHVVLSHRWSKAGLRHALAEENNKS